MSVKTKQRLQAQHNDRKTSVRLEQDFKVQSERLPQELCAQLERLMQENESLVTQHYKATTATEPLVQQVVDALRTKRTHLSTSEPQPPKAVFDTIAKMPLKHQQPLHAYLVQTTNLLLCSDIVACAMLSVGKGLQDLVTRLTTELDHSLAAQRELLTALEEKESIEGDMDDLVLRFEETQRAHAHKWVPPLCMYTHHTRLIPII
jgi:hypothetical protein